LLLHKIEEFVNRDFYQFCLRSFSRNHNMADYENHPRTVDMSTDKSMSIQHEMIEDVAFKSDHLDDALASDGTDFKWDFQVLTNLIALFFTFFASTFMLVVPSSAIGFIEEAFPSQAGIGIWIASSSIVMNCVLNAFIGKVSDDFGRKWPLLLGMALGVAGTLISSRAKSLTTVIAGQVLNGSGWSLGYLAIPYVQEVVPKSKRPIIMALVGVVSGLAPLVGGIISGAFIKHNVGGVGQGWRVPFYLGAGLYALSFLAVLFFYHPQARPNPQKLTIAQRLRQVDWLGIFLVTAGLVIFLVGIESGDNPTPWKSARVIVCIIVGVILITAFGIWEWKGTTTGLLSHDLFVHPNFKYASILTVVGGIILFGGQAFLPQEVIYLYTHDAVLTGVYALPFNVASMIGAIVGGIWMTKSGEAKPAIMFAFALLVLGNCLMLYLKPHMEFAAWFFPTAFLGTSVGIVTTMLIVVVTICTPNHLIAAGVSVIASTRALGGSVGTVIFSQIFAAKVKKYIPAAIATAAVKAGLAPAAVPLLVDGLLTGNVTMIEMIPGITPTLIGVASEAMSVGYAEAFRYVWYSLLPFSALSLALCFLLKSTKAQLTAQVAAGVDRSH